MKTPIRFFVVLQYIIPLALLGLVVWAVMNFVFSLSPPSASVRAPEITGEDIDGVTFKLSDYRGKVVVLDFWGNW
jgi:hypothetical protein